MSLQFLRPDDFPLLLQRGQPGGEVVADRNDAAGGRLGLAGTNLDDPAFQIHRFPVEPVEFSHADPCERPDGENRHDMGRRVVKQPRHLFGCEDRHVIEFHAHLRDGFNRRGFLVRQVVLYLGK